MNTNLINNKNIKFKYTQIINKIKPLKNTNKK